MTHTTNKTIKAQYYQHDKSRLYSLNDCYRNASYNKQCAFNRCLELCRKYDGRHLKIISYNTMQFTVGFIGEIDNKTAFFYITRDHDRYIYLDEIVVKRAMSDFRSATSFLCDMD